MVIGIVLSMQSASLVAGTCRTEKVERFAIKCIKDDSTSVWGDGCKVRTRDQAYKDGESVCWMHRTRHDGFIDSYSNPVVIGLPECKPVDKEVCTIDWEDMCRGFAGC